MLAAGEDLILQTHVRDSSGKVVPGPKLHHRIFLTGVHGDSPFRIKVAKTLGVGAYLACGWCCFQGSYIERGMRFLVSCV